MLRKKIQHPAHGKTRQVVLPLHIDMIQDKFWEDNAEILGSKPSEMYTWPQDVDLPDLVLRQLHISTKSTDDKKGSS